MTHALLQMQTSKEYEALQVDTHVGLLHAYIEHRKSTCQTALVLQTDTHQLVLHTNFRGCIWTQDEVCTYCCHL